MSYQVRCMHLNECTSYRSTSFAYLPLWHLKLHLKFDSIKVWIVQQRESLLLHDMTYELSRQGDTSVIHTTDNVHSTSASATIYNWVNDLNVVVPHMMHLVHVQLRLLRQKSSIKSTILFWLIDEWKCTSLLKLQAYGTVISILHKQLDMKKLSAKWVPAFAH